MAKRITMLNTAAFPDAIYHEGKTYIMPDELADAILAVGSGANLTSPAGVVADRKAKLSKSQSPPDPGEDKSEDDLIEDDEDE